MGRRARRAGAVVAVLAALGFHGGAAVGASALVEEQETTSVDFETEVLPEGVELVSERAASGHPSDLASSGSHVLRLDCERSCVGNHRLLSFDVAHHTASIRVGYHGDLGVDLTITLTALTADGLDLDRDSTTFTAGESLEALTVLRLSTDEEEAAIHHLRLTVEIEEPVVDDPDDTRPRDGDPEGRDPEGRDPEGSDPTDDDSGGVDLIRFRSDGDPAGRPEFAQDRGNPLPGAIVFDDLVIIRTGDQPPGPSDSADQTTGTAITASEPSTRTVSGFMEDNWPWFLILLVLAVVVALAARRVRSRPRPDSDPPQTTRVEPRWDDGEATLRETVRPLVEITGRLDPGEGSTTITDASTNRGVR